MYSSDVISALYAVLLTCSCIGKCFGDGSKAKKWKKTMTGGKLALPNYLAGPNSERHRFKLCKQLFLLNGDACTPGDWVLIRDRHNQETGQRVGMVFEIIQVAGSPEDTKSRPSFISIQLAEITGVSNFNYMPTLRLTDQLKLVSDVVRLFHP